MVDGQNSLAVIICLERLRSLKAVLAMFSMWFLRLE